MKDNRKDNENIRKEVDLMGGGGENLSSMKKTPITVAYGDGIGPNIMKATLKILEAAGAQLDIETIEIGEKVYLSGNTTGIDESAWESLKRTKVFLKAPITTPQGGGYKSLNVTARKALGLYANIRPCVAYSPYVKTKHPDMDVVIVRENEEDLYAGIEHQQTTDVVQCIKLISRPASERIIRYAFEYAVTNNRKKVTCFTKDNIMKLSDGLFHKVFDEISKEYPDIENEHWIVDIGAAKLADTPENFDVVVLQNLYGDILSDVCAQIAGSVGMAGSANIGANYAMFEAIHGSAPRLTGKGVANPSGLFMGSLLMLQHIGQIEVADKAHNAWLKTIEDGIHTKDIYNEGISTKKVGTEEFGDAVIERLGQKPEKLKPAVHNPDEAKREHKTSVYVRPEVKRELVGVDVFLHSEEKPDVLGEQLQKCEIDGLKLIGISTRGMSVWPKWHEETFLSDHLQCRFFAEEGIEPKNIIELLEQVEAAGLEFIKTENLYNFNGERVYTRSQGA